MSDLDRQEDHSARTGAARATFAEDTVESLAAMLRVLADPTRIRLIEALDGRGRATVGALAGLLPVTPQGVSRQLGVLHQAGLVRRRRRGMSVEYELCDWTGLWLLEQLAGSIGAGRGE